MPYIVPKLVCYAQTLPIILEGANLHVQIIILLCDVKHPNCNTNLKPGLGTHWEIYLAIWREGSITGPWALGMGMNGYFPVWDWDCMGTQIGTGHSQKTKLPIYFNVTAQLISYSRVILSGTIIPKLCQHNQHNPSSYCYCSLTSRSTESTGFRNRRALYIQRPGPRVSKSRRSLDSHVP